MLYFEGELRPDIGENGATIIRQPDPHEFHYILKAQEENSARRVTAVWKNEYNDRDMVTVTPADFKPQKPGEFGSSTMLQIYAETRKFEAVIIFQASAE